ncbi:MAG TPA: hypothetical protein VK447_02855, partial [Myxococcaceae bacterium]|nr:hypothetical protein [Myxococcaceae bacterium]
MPPSSVRSQGPLAGPALLGGLVAVVGAALFVLFPGRAGIQRQVTDVRRPDPVSLAYLRALSAERPDDAQARLRLSGEYLRLGRLDEARGTVAPLLAAPEAAGRSARLLALRIEAARWRGLPEGERGPSRAAVERALAERLGDVVGDEARELEALALELGRMDLAAELALREAERAPKERVPWLVRAGEHHLAQGQPALAAADFVHAAEAARGAEGHGLAARALDTLRGVPDPERVLSLTSRLLARYPGRAELLDRAVGLARAHGRGADARGWMGARLALSPTDAAAVERALEL